MPSTVFGKKRQNREREGGREVDYFFRVEKGRECVLEVIRRC